MLILAQIRIPLQNSPLPRQARSCELISESRADAAASDSATQVRRFRSLVPHLPAPAATARRGAAFPHTSRLSGLDPHKATPPWGTGPCRNRGDQGSAEHIVLSKLSR